MQLVVWGGSTFAFMDSGGSYDPLNDAWTPTSRTGTPDPRIDHSIVWTGERAIVWGGTNGLAFQTGARYDPRTDTW